MDATFNTAKVYRGKSVFAIRYPSMSWVKRSLDLLLSGLLIVLVAPFFLCIALLIQLDSPGPVFYRQERMGLNNKTFKVWKFRTMVTNADKLQSQLQESNDMNGVLFKMKDDPRITRLGKFMRAYSIDELPQLFNVLVGEMSLVGPRPFSLSDLKNFSQHHMVRHQVVPGITGLWQVSGRSNITNFDDVVRLDTCYIETWSLLLDLKILLKTIIVVLKKTGAY